MLKYFPRKTLKRNLIILLFVLSAPLFAQIGKTNYKILGVSVEGNKIADANTIIANSGLKIGGEIEIPGDQTMAAIKRLWSLNIFSDVQIIIDKEIQNGVFLIIKVEEHRRVHDYVYEGCDDLDESDFKKKVSFTPGQILKPQDIYKARRRIKALYDEEGYLNATIEPKIYVISEIDSSKKNYLKIAWRSENDLTDEYEKEYDVPYKERQNFLRRIKDRVLLKFNIEEGPKVIVRKIEFNGNNAFSDGKLRGAFDETEESKWWKFWSRAKLNKELYKKDKELLINFYRKEGFRDVRILSDSLYYYNNNKDVKIVINLYEGPQYKIRNINWKGNTVYKEEILNARLGFQKGDIYDYEKFERNLLGNETQTDVAALYYDNGYLMIRLIPEEERVAEDSLDINVRIIENNRFKIGEVSIKGNDKTKEKVIRRELYTVPDDYFSRSLMFRSLQQLANLQYFNIEKLYREGIEQVPANDSIVNVAFVVEEKSSDYLNASIGYSGSWGFSGSMGFTLNNFSIIEPFQLGGGQRLDFNWQFGINNYYRTFSIGFMEPWFLDKPTMVGFDLFYTRQSYVYSLTQTGLTLKVGRRLKWPDNYFYIQGFFRYQKNDVQEGGMFYYEGKSHQYTLGMTISRKDIDNPIFPTQGSSLTLSPEISGGPFLPGNVDYYKVELNFELYKRLLPSSNRLAFYTGFQIGFLDEFVGNTPINPFEYFYMGGNGMVIATTPLRGYLDRSIGGRYVGNEIKGGRLYNKYTAEFRVAATLEPMPIYFLAFAEAGNVFESVKTSDFFDLKRSVGVGARLFINPLGLIGFDFGYGFDRKSVDGMNPQWEFHFQFGRGF